MQKAALKSLRPSEKADHKTVLEEHGLKREVCTDGTRVKILEDISRWANDRSLDSPRVFWLTGQAGSGKTTIAYTIAKHFEDSGNAIQHTVLGGNFLCSRQFQETQAETRIIPTIAYQLAHKCDSYASTLHVADKFDTVNHDVSSQISGLLVGPWQQSEATRHPELPPYLIVIDALDEIKGDGGSAFLRNLLRAINEYNLRGFKFLVTSRPNPKVAALCESFTSEAVCRLQDVPIEEAKSDIKTYLKTELRELASSPEFSELEQRAGGLFIYAATAVKYLTPCDSITVGEKTEMLDDFLSKSYEPTSSSDATFLIDELYRQIMCDAFRISAEKFWLADCAPFIPSCVWLNAHLPLSLLRLSWMVMMKPQRQFCVISMQSFIPKMIKCFGIMLPSLNSSLMMHGQTFALITRTSYFHAMNQPTTVSLANLASVS